MNTPTVQAPLPPSSPTPSAASRHAPSSTPALLALLRREWLQHRWGWALSFLIPVGLFALGIAIGPNVQMEGDLPDRAQWPLIVASVAVLAGPAVMLMLALSAALGTAASLARRDHADRSVEFWLSQPTSHSANFAVPLGAHLLLWPAVATVLGWLAGLVLGPALVLRIGSAEALANLPWSHLLIGSGTLVLRVLAGLPLALLWVLPILLLLMLLNAWAGKWGWLILAAGLALGGGFERLIFGKTWLVPTLQALLQHAALSLFGAGGPERLSIHSGEDVSAKLQSLPLAAMHDFIAALGQLASPLFVGALAFSAAFFYGLVRWRRAGAGAKD